MKEIELNNEYSYLPENNVLVNCETLNRFKNYFSNNKIILKDIKIDEDILKKKVKKISKITFEITQDCNLRCRYCIYNGSYHYNRKFTNKSLDFEIAKKGLEYLYKLIRRRQSKKINIGFYGGEPFLRLNIIKRIVTYSKNLFKGWDILFTATTNATLLNDRVIQYLIKENFKILVSLDGSKRNHDSKRVDKNGKGSFKKVWESLNKIKFLNYEYFKKNVLLSIVHSYDQPILELYEFFSKNNLINKSTVKYSTVDAKGTDYFKEMKVNKTRLNEEFKCIYDKLLYKIKDEINLTSLEIEIYTQSLNESKLFSRPNTLIDGTCLFDSKLMIDVNGKFHICENINHSLSIGNVWQGFNYKKMHDMVKKFNEIKKDVCSNCEVKYLCSPCFATLAKEGVLGNDNSFCKMRKESLISKLKRQIRFEEKLLEIRKSNYKKELFKFHEFVTIIDGYINSAIIDFIKGDIYQVPKGIVKQFLSGNYLGIEKFVKDADSSGLLIKVKNKTWIPNQNNRKEELRLLDKLKNNDVVLSLEEGVDYSNVKNHVSDFNISRINYYGSKSNLKSIEKIFSGIQIDLKKKDMERCSSISMIKRGCITKTNRGFYDYSRVFNNCWGRSIAVTKDEIVRPCIYSEISICNLNELKSPGIIDKLEKYWYLTKDEIETCKICELRFSCFDCREIAYRKSMGDLYAKNPNCGYNPKTGIWNEENKV